MSEPLPSKQFMAWLIWSLAVIFYLYEFAIRITPSVIVPELMTGFRIDAAMVGLLSALYLYIYAPMQLPVGVMMDRWGAKRLLSLAAIAAGAGGVLFGLSTAFWVAGTGRLLMGVGSAFGFIGLIYVSTHWFGRARLPWLIGLGNSLGMLGGILGLGPVAGLVTHLGWRTAAVAIGVLGIGLGVMIYLAVRGAEPHKTKDPPRFSTIFRNLKLIGRLPNTWINAGVAFFFYSTTTAFAGLWAVPFLQNVYHLDKPSAGTLASLNYVGWIIGGPILGLIANKAHRMKPVLVGSTASAFVCIGCLVYLPLLPMWAVAVLLLGLGVACSGELVTYSLAVRISPPAAKGTAPALTNFFAFISGALMQPFVGWILDTAGNFRIALTTFPLSLLAAFALSLCLRPIQARKMA